MLVSKSGASLADIFSGFKTNFNKGFEGAKSTIATIAMEVPSTAAEETYAWLGTFPMIREWVGDRVVHNLAAWAYTIKNKNFEMTVSVGGNQMEDDQYGLFSPLMLEMGREAAIHPDRLAYALLNEGFNSLCYDGQNFFDPDHPVEGADGAVTTVSNMQAGAGPAWFLIDASRQLRPLVHQKRRAYRFVSLDNPNDANVFWKNEYVYGCDGRSNVGFGLWQLAFGSKAALTHENYEAARTAMASFTKDGGAKLGITPTHLVVPQELEGAARRVVKNGTRVITVGTEEASQDVVISNEWQDTADLLVSAYL